MKQVVKYLMIAVGYAAIISVFADALKAGLEQLKVKFPEWFTDLEQKQNPVEKQGAAPAPSKPHFETSFSESEVIK